MKTNKGQTERTGEELGRILIMYAKRILKRLKRLDRVSEEDETL